MPVHREDTEIRMCADCGCAFEYRPENFNRKPDTHRQADDSCPTNYCE